MCLQQMLIVFNFLTALCGQMVEFGIWTLLLPQGVKIRLIFTLQAVVSEMQTNFENCLFGHETWNLKKFKKLYRDCGSTYTKESNLNLLSLNGKRFPS